MLFGPWTGGIAGALGYLAWPVLTRGIGPDWWGFALSYFVAGALPGLMVKDARNLRKVLGAGVAASVAYAPALTITVGAATGWWRDLPGIARWFLLPALLPNALLLPLLARWLVGPVRRLGLY